MRFQLHSGLLDVGVQFPADLAGFLGRYDKVQDVTQPATLHLNSKGGFNIFQLSMVVNGTQTWQWKAHEIPLEMEASI